MPHVIVKLYPERSEEHRLWLANAVAKDLVPMAECAERSVSVALMIKF